MDKRTITALMLAFMVVKTPVSLVGTAVYAEPQISTASATSEADITKNINQTLQRPEILTTEEKAAAQMADYHIQLEAEAAKIKAEELARIARENGDRIAKLQSVGLSSEFVGQYADAEKRFGVPWQVTAAVHMVESGMSGDRLVTSYAGAQGPMQFMPSTFAAFAVDGDNDGVTNINDVDDAIMSAANYMASNGGGSGQITNALFRYNHDMGYVNHVLSIANSLGLK
ncbi:MAG: lytic transglycosylase domain-containing protein [bacterium]